MLSRVFKKRSGETKKDDYDDIAGVITTIGVLSALLLGLLLSMAIETQPRKQPEGEFRGLLCSSQEFRSYVIETMDTFAGGVGAYKAQPFNFSLPVGKGQTLDMRKYLESIIHQRHGEVSSRPDLPSCLKDVHVGAIAEALVSVFPMAMMNVFININNPPVRISDGIEKPLCIGFGFNLVCLLCSVVLYLSLSISPSHEDESGKTLTTWLRIGWPMIVVLCMLFFCSLISFLVSYARMLQWNSPFFDQSFANVSTIGISAISIPGSLIGGILSLAAYIMSTNPNLTCFRKNTADGSGNADATEM